MCFLLIVSKEKECVMKIEKCIPIPSEFKGRGRHRSKYPFVEMQSGDSVFFEGQNCSGNAVASARQLTYRSEGEHRFIAKNVDGGVRIWKL